MAFYSEMCYCKKCNLNNYAFSIKSRYMFLMSKMGSNLWTCHFVRGDGISTGSIVDIVNFEHLFIIPFLHSNTEH